jgi:hypothetical protein
VVLLLTAVAAAAGTVVFAAPAHAVGPYYQIVSYNSGKCLQPRSSNYNALIEIRDCNALNSAQQWNKTLYPGTSEVVFTNAWSGMCLDIQANSPEEVVPNVPTQQFVCAPDAYPSERWFESGEVRTGGYIQIVTFAGNSTMCLDIRNNSSSNGALVVLGSCATSDRGQAFKVAIV